LVVNVSQKVGLVFAMVAIIAGLIVILLALFGDD
jgi:hypothetical protein